jgi:hypothetical protein
MNPMDFITLFLCAALACGSVATRGWTVNGLGPATLLMGGGVWHFWMQWLPEYALPCLAHEGISFIVEGPATYEQLIPAVRNPPSSPGSD